MFNIPILYLIFNRPNLVKITFERIKEIKPKYLFIAADGPRINKANDIQKCRNARDYVLKNIDWDCEVKTLFRDENLGCKYAVSSAIDWFFENIEMGIILEDDVLPDPSFFPFCKELLERYKENTKIMHIGGTNFQFGRIRGDGNYYFSKITHIWGWATWRRAWSLYDVHIKSFSTYTPENFNFFKNKRVNEHFYEQFSQTFSGNIDTWDYQWNYSVLINHGKSIIPNNNLVSNIGYGKEGTHTKHLEDIFANIPLKKLNLPLTHPQYESVNERADNYYFSKIMTNNFDLIKVKIKIFLSYFHLEKSIRRFIKR